MFSSANPMSQNLAHVPYYEIFLDNLSVRIKKVYKLKKIAIFMYNC